MNKVIIWTEEDEGRISNKLEGLNIQGMYIKQAKKVPNKHRK